MKTTINYSALLVILILTGTYWAQAGNTGVTGTGKITGNIRNALSDLPLVNVTVTLFAASDSSMVAGTISDNFGNFYLCMLDSGNYYLVISETGYEKREICQLNVQKENPKLDIGEIMMAQMIETRRRNKNK